MVEIAVALSSGRVILFAAIQDSLRFLSWALSVKEFGVFVEISPGVEGLCHISELSDGFVKNTEDVCKVGDLIPVKLLAIDDQGRFKLSRRAALAQLSKEKEKDRQRVAEKK